VVNRVSRIAGMVGVLLLLGPVVLKAQDQKNAEAPPGQAPPPAAADALPPLPGPAPVNEVALGPVLQTVPVQRATKEYNWTKVDTTPLPIEKQGIWVLEIHFRPVRIIQIEIPGKGRKKLHYMYYRVINRTGKPRMFVPQFTLVTDTRKSYADKPIKAAVKAVQMREDPTIPLLGAVTIFGMIPPSNKEGIDDAVYGVAVWEGVDPAADAFKVFVQGLSDGYKDITPPSGGKTVTQHKTLEIDFLRRGDAHDIREKEIELLDPPYDWIYR
jgi:hypothetical protein